MHMLPADALDIIFPVAMVVVPFVVGVITLLIFTRSEAGATKRLGQELAGTSPYPLSQNCPACGSEESTKAPGREHFLVNIDRVCKGCGVRYTYPPSRA